MQHITNITELRQQTQSWGQQGLQVGLVATMGNLHAGHLSLVELAAKHADKVVVTIFVNPLQFGPNEDFATYPRTLAEDCQLLKDYPVSLVFTPSVESMYSQEPSMQITVPGLGEDLCGVTRPHFFSGVATVVAKLFNLVQPDVAVFGEKDFQQLLVMRRLVQAFNFPIEIIGAPIVRETDGLAMSSRNRYLTPEQRRLAPQLYQHLQRLAEHIKQSPTQADMLIQHTIAQLNALDFQVDYLTLRREADLQPASTQDNPVRLLTATYLGATRLLDNVRV